MRLGAFLISLIWNCFWRNAQICVIRGIVGATPRGCPRLRTPGVQKSEAPEAFGQGRHGGLPLPIRSFRKWHCPLWAFLLAVGFPLWTAAESPLDPVWFYDRDMRRQTPEMGTDWVAVGLASDPTAEPEQAALALDGAIPGVAEVLYDPNLAEDAAFLRFSGDGDPSSRAMAIRELATLPSIRFVHPAFWIDGEPTAALDRFRMEWKHGVAPETRRRLAEAAGAERISGDLWRIHTTRRPFFEAVNLLAEDLHVRYATPELVRIRPTIQGNLDLQIPGGLVGDPIPVQLTIRFSEGIDLDPAGLARLELRPSAIPDALFEVWMETVDHVAAAAHDPVRIRGELRFLAPGDFQLPELSLPYTCRSCPGEPVRRLEIAGPTVRIASLIPPDAEARLLLPPDPPTLDWNPKPMRNAAHSHFLWAIGWLLVGILCLISFWLLRRRRGNSSDGAPESPEPSGISELRDLLEREPDGPHWRYLRDIGRGLRLLLRDRFAPENPADGGSGVRFFARIVDRIPPEDRATLLKILERVDRAAAREEEFVSDLDVLRDTIRLWLERESTQDPPSPEIPDDSHSHSNSIGRVP